MNDDVTPPTALIRMVNQIASNYGHLAPDEASRQVAEHLRMFWAPAMRVQLGDWVREGGDGVDPVAAAAVAGVTA